MRQNYLPFALPDIDDSEFLEVQEALKSGWVTTGPKTKKFEADFGAVVGAKQSVAVNSCTAALHLALEAVGVKRGDEVITTPYTFAASAEVIRYFDARPVLVDVEAEYFCMNPTLIERAITPRTKAILPVHIAGNPANLDPILEIARRHSIPVIEDAAHSFPAKYKGKMIGAIGDITCFSFYATKTITTGEGGMLCTENDEWADRARIMSLHGISRDAWKRYTAEGSWYYEITSPGFKYNLTDVAAGMGLAQLRKATAMFDRRTRIAERYNREFSSMKELQVPGTFPGAQHAWHLYMLRLNTDQLKIDRAQFIEEMKKRNIGTSVHFIPLHIHPYYRDTFGYKADDLPVAHREYLREVSLPIFSKMSDEDVSSVIEAVGDIIASNRR